MRVGAYIDGLNLFYGGKSICGPSRPGWRWLDVRKLCEDLIARQPAWTSLDAVLDRVVYCTAFIAERPSSLGRQHQVRYVAALRSHQSFDQIMKGRFTARVVRSPLALEHPKSGKPTLVTSHWPVVVKDAADNYVSDAIFMVSHLRSEEKRTDVNLASQLLLDVLGERVDAAIVVSNDSDLRYPIQECRQRVPVGTVNPSSRRLAGDLRGQTTDGVGNHWWTQLQVADFVNCQLPDPVGGYAKPPGW